MEPIGRMLVGIGLIAVVLGGILLLLGRAGVSSLPGDMSFGRGSWRVYIPLGTSIVLSVILTLLLNIFRRR